MKVVQTRSRREFLCATAALGASGCLPTRSLTIPPDLPRRGAADPALVIEEIGDYQCPYCRAAQPHVERLLEHYAQRVTLVWRNYPLPRHEHAALAAEAALEARAQLGDDGFWRYHRVLFRNQHALERDDLERYAEAFAIERRRFSRALELRIHRDAVERDVRYVDSLELPSFGTPAFLIDGDVFIGVYTFAELSSLVDQRL